MTKNLPLLIILFLLHIPLASFAQIVVTFPSSRAVFQRNTGNQADVYIGGYTDEVFIRIEARFVVLVADEGEANPTDGVSWQVIDNTIEAGHFYGMMTMKGGWYRLEVRGIKQNGLISSTSVDKVGVGEVFVVAGQSNATGGDQNDNGPGAQRDQVNSVNFQNYNPATLTSYTYDSTQLPCPEYVHLDAGVKTAPYGNYAWCWGSFGDQLYDKLKVPVMIFNAGWSSSGVDNWQQSIDPGATTLSAFGLPFPEGQPFGNLRLALNNYAAQLGVRAVLWHQGETDNYLEQPGDNTYNRYVNALWQVIGATRVPTGKDNLAWLVSRASRFTVNGTSRTSSNVINAQNELVTNDVSYPFVYAGPATDDYYDMTYRGDQIHFKGAGLVSLAGFWVDQITPEFLNTSQPYAALPPPAVTAAYVTDGTQIKFTAPGNPGGTYKWLGTDCKESLSTAQEWVAGSGRYKLKMVDSHNNAVYSPQLYVKGTMLPVTWKSFLAKTSDNGRAYLEWSTSTEVNSSHFDVERSTNAFKFNTVKTIAAAGASKNAIQYRFEDEYLPSGTYYYRLKQVDLDGRSEYTKIESVKINVNLTARAYPNPVHDWLTIEAGEALGKIEVIDVKGARLYESETQLKNKQINMLSFPSGLYKISVNGKTFKVIK